MSGALQQLVPTGNVHGGAIDISSIVIVSCERTIVGLDQEKVDAKSTAQPAMLLLLPAKILTASSTLDLGSSFGPGQPFFSPYYPQASRKRRTV
jgi:hypothetical protein